MGKILSIGFIAGVFGGILLIITTLIDFNLGFLHGYLYLLIIIISMITGLKISQINGNKLGYWKRLIVSIYVFLITALCFLTYKLSYDEHFSYNDSTKDLLSVVTSMFGLGLTLSLIAASLVWKKKN